MALRCSAAPPVHFTLVRVSRTTSEVDKGKAKFNAAFAKCPVVQYVRDGVTHSIYVRKSPIPKSFDAYTVFTENWNNTDQSKLPSWAAQQRILAF